MVISYQGGARAYLTTGPGQHYWESCTLISGAERNSLLFQPLQTYMYDMYSVRAMAKARHAQAGTVLYIKFLFLNIIGG